MIHIQEHLNINVPPQTFSWLTGKLKATMIPQQLTQWKCYTGEMPRSPPRVPTITGDKKLKFNECYRTERWVYTKNLLWPHTCQFFKSSWYSTKHLKGYTVFKVVQLHRNPQEALLNLIVGSQIWFALLLHFLFYSGTSHTSSLSLSLRVISFQNTNQHSQILVTSLLSGAKL